MKNESWKEFARSGPIIYEASNQGRFRRIGKTKISFLKPFFRNCYESKKNRPHTLIIRISLNSKPKEFNCKKLIATLFIRNLKENEVVINKNGDPKDIRASNLFITSRKNLGQITGGKSSKSKRIIYYDHTGFRMSYPSARKLAKELGVSYQTVLDIANNKTKKPKFKIEWEGKNEMQDLF